MAKNNIDEHSTPKNWKEGELIQTFGLTSITTQLTPLMQDWLDAETITLTEVEQSIFDKILLKARKNLRGWNEEDLKIKFIGVVLDLGYMLEDEGIIAYFDKTISATVEGIKLIVKSDFMLAKGVLDAFTTPYFHFQEYKPSKNPTGDSMAQLLEAFLIAQVKNQNNNPLYGVEIVGANWNFVIMEGKTYCISPSFDATDRKDLMQIIAMLRKFKQTLLNNFISPA